MKILSFIAGLMLCASVAIVPAAEVSADPDCPPSSIDCCASTANPNGAKWIQVDCECQGPCG